MVFYYGLNIWCLILSKVKESIALGRDNSHWHFLAVEPAQARVYLTQLIQGYIDGLNTPLALLNQSGWSWLMACYDKKASCLILILRKFNRKLMEF